MEKKIIELQKIQSILKFMFIAVPIIAGADKFTNLLTNWVRYFNPALANIFPFSALVFMLSMGIVEIGAGLLALINPQKGAYVLTIWFILIALNLITNKIYFDIAILDLVIAVVAFTFARVTAITSRINKPV